jgi:hypothetical protein
MSREVFNGENALPRHTRFAMRGSGSTTASGRLSWPETGLPPQSSRCWNDTATAASAANAWSGGTAGDQSTHAGVRSVSEDIVAVIRDHALEEAARIADQVAAGRDDMLQGLAALGALIAEGIRSLKQCEQSTPRPVTSRCGAADPKHGAASGNCSDLAAAPFLSGRPDSHHRQGAAANVS